MLSRAEQSCLVLVQPQFNEEFRKHSVDPIQGDVGLTQLMLDIETVPDIPNCTIVLCEATEGVIDKCYNSPWMHILSCFDT